MRKLEAHVWIVGMVIFILSLSSCSREHIDQSSDKFNLNDTGSTVAVKISESYKKNSSSGMDDCGMTYTGLPVHDETCTTTDFAEILFQHISELVNDPAFDPTLTNYYTDLNKKYVTHFRGENYYGENGEFNQLAKKRLRELDQFWDLDREIILNGQHTISLDNRESLAAMIESFDPEVRNREEAYAKADALISYNASTLNYPENPFFALDAFTKKNGLLVIGDGLLQTFIETGIDEKVAFTGIISHEWWHQVQYEFENEWGLAGNFDNPAHKSRYLELEADFAAAYFMAHKRGATFNWKLIEQYFELSFNAGDCFVQSNQHHGTPQQRLRAAKFGFELADNSKRKGFILSPDVVHQEFLNFYTEIIGE